MLCTTAALTVGAGSVDGALHLPGVAGTILLVRASGSNAGAADSLYRLRGGRVVRLQVELPAGGVVRGMVGRTSVDVDCGPAPRTLVQVLVTPLRGGRWHRVSAVLELRGRRFVRIGTLDQRISGALAARRRCALDRRFNGS